MVESQKRALDGLKILHHFWKDEARRAEIPHIGSIELNCFAKLQIIVATAKHITYG